MKLDLLIPLLFILFIGIPHGASDILIARRRFKNSWPKILFFLISYLFVAIIFTTAWFFYPLLCLMLFLFISGLHFGLLDTLKMPTSSLKFFQALIYGLTPIIIPIVFHTREVNEIFKLLLFDENSDIAYQMENFFLVWLLGLIIFFVKYPESSQRQVLEIIALASLLVTVPPLWGFAFYFCFVHSIRHFLNLRKELNNPHKLSDAIEINKMNLDDLSKMALDDPSTSSNPKKLTINDMKVMYEHSILGKLF